MFPAGGGTDIVTRIVFQKVGEQMNQQFLIDNRAGASGMIGAAIVAKSPPDGYTLMVYSQTLLNNMHLYQKVPYDALKDFDGITMLTRMVGMLAVHPSMPVQHDEGVHRPGESAARRDPVRHGRRRRLPASCDERFRQHGRHQDEPCPLQGRRSGGHCADGRRDTGDASRR